MRPALLRLLKRPSALSVIDSLISSPFGIESLDFGLKTRCVLCQSPNQRPRHTPERTTSEKPAKNELSTRSTKQPSGFRVREIRSSLNKPSIGSGSARFSSADDNTISWKRLALQPEQLEFESDVGHTHNIGTRLVDDPTYQNDFSLWSELLRYRQRRYGDNGTLGIWKGLMSRVGGLQLPVKGEAADLFWQSFVDLGFKQEAILNEVCDYSQELWRKTGKRWPRLYRSIVGGFINCGMPRQAVKWHKRLQNPHLTRPADVTQCLESIDSISAKPGGEDTGLVRSQESALASKLAAFRDVCKHTTGHRIYKPVISVLVERDKFKEAFRMHLFLVERGDHPRTYDDLQPLLEHARRCGPRNTYEKLRRYANRRFPRHNKQMEAVESNDKPESSIPGDWFEEKRFKDEFGARVFATKALNFEMILSGLKMFSVPAIGPQSLREMATRARGSQDILKRLDRLEKGGISIGNSVFARLLRKLATENREILLSDLLNSDQHPDMLEDAQVQEALLGSYYAVRDWRQYNLTLAVLRELLGDGPSLFNIHIRKHIAVGEWALASKVVDEMLTQGSTPTNETIAFMVKNALSLRKVGTGPAQQPNVHATQDVTFVFRVLQRIAQAGASVSPMLWIELIKRFGMADNWDELRACCLWLARHYRSCSTVTDSSTLPRSYGHHILQSILNPQMQDAIISWGFAIQPPTKVRTYHTNGVDGEKLVPFVRGIVLLRELKQLGVPLQLGRICRVCRQRLSMLYGRPVFSSRPKNRALRRENPYIAEQVISDINRAWGDSPLLDDQERNRLYRLLHPPGHRRPRIRPHPLYPNQAIV